MIQAPIKDIPRIPALLIIFLGNLVFFLPYLFTAAQQTIGAESGDLLSFFRPMREFVAAQLAAGHFPLWNPYSSNGRPFIADPETGLLYPFTYLFTILPSHLAFSWNYFIHYLICGYGIFFLCRRFRVSRAGSLTAVFIYLFSAPHILHLYAGHFTMINTLAWTPWLFWSLERFLVTLSWRHAAGFGLFLGLHLLGGFPQYTYMIGWATLAYGLYVGFSKKLFASFGKIFIRLGCGFVLGTGLFLTQATLTTELIDHSTRQKNSFAFVSSYSISKENLITLFVPKYYGETATGGTATSGATTREYETNPYFGKTFVWENSCYMGVISLMLFLTALGKWKDSFIRFWFYVFLVSFVIATGPLTPLFQVLHDYLPGFSSFRGYSKALTVSCLALAILAGKGLDRMADRSGGPWIKNYYLGIPLTLLGLSVISLAAPDALPFWKTQLLQQLGAWKLPVDSTQIVSHFSMLRIDLFMVTLVAILAACVYWLSGKFSALSQHFSSIFCLLIFFEFFIYAKPYFSPLDFRSFVVSDSLTHPITGEPRWTRTFHSHPIVANLGLADNVSAVGGFENFTLKGYGKLASYFNGAPLNSKNHYLTIDPTPQNMNFYAADYLLSNKEPPFPMNKIADGVIAGAQWTLHKKPDASSRYHIAHEIEPFPIGTDEDYAKPERFAKFAQAMLKKYPETVFVSPDTYRRIFTEKLSDPKPPDAKENIEVIAEKTNRVNLQVELASPGILTVSENYYPGWRSKIDGVEAEVFPVNLIMKAVAVPSGRHHVEFYFVPTHFYANILVSSFSLLTLLGLIVFNPQERRLKENTTGWFSQGP